MDTHDVITLTHQQRSALLGPAECHLNELETRLRFLAGFFEAADAFQSMGGEMLHILLSDCRDGSIAARECLEQAWASAGGTPSTPEVQL